MLLLTTHPLLYIKRSGDIPFRKTVPFSKESSEVVQNNQNLVKKQKRHEAIITHQVITLAIKNFVPFFCGFGGYRTVCPSRSALSMQFRKDFNIFLALCSVRLFLVLFSYVFIGIHI